MKKNNHLYQEFLLKHGLKSTKQRRLIFEKFIMTQGHVSADGFCNVVKKADPSIGQATVYRMLKLLTESHIARKLEMGDGIGMYELNLGRDHHDHLICEKCFKCVEFKDDALEELQIRLAGDHGFTLTGHKMFLYGLCAQCR